MKFFEILGLVGFLGFIGLVGGWESTYTRLTICTNYNYETQVYTFTDNSGNDWEWEREPLDDFKVGNAYRLVMDDNHTTSNIYDDWIKKIKKY